MLVVSQNNLCSEQTQAISDLCLALIERLYESADDLCDSFYKDWKAALNVAIDRNQKMGGVNPHVRLKEQPVSLEISWKHYKGGYKSSSGENKKLKPAYISKGKSFLYPQKKLEDKCQSWEWPIVCEYEEKFAAIREAYDAITTIRTKNSAAIRKLSKLDAVLKGESHAE
ncbi:hypothetical protein A3715_17210 [Oleiphilus sp. HI0009]|nr:hypothetical protein A3715_17210 [Oleiphilus sp. HI0009]